MSDKAIIIAANLELHDHLGNVESHKKWANNNDKVFWFLVPPGRRKVPWKHKVDVTKGYFYISGTREVQYKFLIEDARTISEFKKPSLLNNVEKFVPDFRMKYWDGSNCGYFYALLIKNIRKIHEIPLCEFELINPCKPVERVQNYVIVQDKQTREVAA